MPTTAYLKRKEGVREAQRAATRFGRDIGEHPDKPNRRRKRRCHESFRAFCEEYLPNVFYLPWSEDHLRVIAKIERAVKHGSAQDQQHAGAGAAGGADGQAAADAPGPGGSHAHRHKTLRWEGILDPSG